jgi:hypothetical protein
MKKFYLILLFFFIANLTFVQKNFAQKNQNISQNKNEWKWAGTIRFKPAQTFVNLVMNKAFDIAVAWTPYVKPNLGIPVELEVMAMNGVVGLGLMAGIEGVPVRYKGKEKSGLYLDAMLGFLYYTSSRYYVDTPTFFAAKTHIGYQLVTSSGFVFTPALGVRYNPVENFAFDLMLDIGFAYKKKR